MKRNFIAFICLISFLTPYIHAYDNSSFLTINISDGEGEKLPLQIKKDEKENGNGEPDRRTLIPEVTLQGNTLHFITPCNGCTFRLVQGGNICYEVEITGNTLNIPATFTGMYELQIISGDTIFYTEVEM